MHDDMHHHHHHDEFCDHHHHGHLDHHKHAPDCDDQLPLLAHVGRGLQGNGFLVRISDPDDCTQTYLEGMSFDEATKEYHSEWITENINGGELSYQYNLRPYTDPRTFTITFIYRRPGRCEWSWTTPAIPYIWTIDNDGNKQEDPDAIVGSGVATIFARASKSEAWNVSKHERLHYPAGTTRNDYNAPLPEKAWSATITFGHGGDIELPNFDDLAKILGVKKGDIFNILEDKTFTIDGIEASNYRDWLLKHLHKDLGFEASGSDHGWENKFGGKPTVKAYIDWAITNVISKYEDLIDELLQYIQGRPTIEDGHIKWPSDNAKIPRGNLNVYGGDSRGKWIKTHDNEANDDVWAR